MHRDRQVIVTLDKDTEKWITDRSKGSFSDHVTQIVKNWVAYMKDIEDKANIKPDVAKEAVCPSPANVIDVERI